MSDDARSKILARRARFLVMAFAGTAACEPKAPDAVTPPPPLPPVVDASAPEAPPDAEPAPEPTDASARLWPEASTTIDAGQPVAPGVQGRVSATRLKPPIKVWTPPPNVCLSIAFAPPDPMFAHIESEVKPCYERVLAVSATHRGSFVLTMDVSATGASSNVKTKDVIGNVDATILACAVDAAKQASLRWGADFHGQKTEVRVELFVVPPNP